MKYFFYLLIFLSINNIFSQSERKLISFDPDKNYTQNFVDSMIENTHFRYESQELKKILLSNEKLIGWPHYYWGRSSTVFEEGKYDSVVYYANSAIKSYLNSDKKRVLDEQTLIKVYVNKGAAFWSLKDHSNSILAYQKALDLTKKYDYKWKSYIYSGIAENHYNIGNDSLALEYFLKCTADSIFMSIPRAAISTYLSLGYLEEDFYVAKSYYLLGLRKSYESDYLDEVHDLYYNIGNLHYEKSELDSTYQYYKKGSDAFDKYGYGDYKNGPLNYKSKNAFIDIEDGKIDDAIIKLNDVFRQLNQYSTLDKLDKYLYNFCTENLYKAYETKLDFKSANSVLKNQIEFLNRHYDDRLKEDIQKIETIYQTKEKDASIFQLEKTRQQQQRIITQRNIISISLLALILAVLALGVYFFKQRGLKNRYEKENLQQKLLRSQMNPHFVFNALNSISALIEKKSEKSIPYVQNLASLFRSILTNSQEDLVGLDEELNTIKNYLYLQSNFSNSFNYNLKVDNDIDPIELFIPPMLIQPFIENSIHHGFINNNPKNQIDILISRSRDQSFLKCVIRDNGIGYSKSKDIKGEERSKHKSFSGNIVRHRLAILKKKFDLEAKFLIKDITPSGTEVELFVPCFKE